MTDQEEARAKEMLERNGYTVIKTKTYLREKEMRRRAESRLEWEKERNEGTYHWANRAFDEQRRLSDRITYVYGVAKEYGAPDEKLADQPPRRCSVCSKPFCDPPCGPTHTQMQGLTPHEESA